MPSVQVSDGQNELHLIEAACRAKLSRLSKEGRIAHNWKGAGLMLLIAAITFASCLYLRLEIYNATDISTAMRGAGRLTYWLTLEATPMLVIAAAWFAVQALRTQVSATFRLECPHCRATHELSAAYRRRFELTCPACYTVVRGSAESHSTRLHCDYCGLEYFDASGSSASCPSCRRKKPGTTAKCPHCSHAVPKGVVCCLHCDRWLGQEESGFGEGTAAYDVTKFSSRVAKTYVVELARRILDVTEGIEAILASAADERRFDPNSAARIGASIPGPTELLPKLALGAAWIRRSGGDAVEPLPSSVGEGLARFEVVIKQLCDRRLGFEDTLTAVETARRVVALRN